MSNQFQSISSGLGMLKIYYQGPMVDQFNEDMPIWRGSEKIKNGWDGAQVNRPLRVQRNQGIGATSDGGSLPKIGRQGTVQATIQAKYNYLRFGVTGPMIKASASNQGSFVRDSAYELEMGYKDLKSDVNRQLSWDGSGTLARVNTAAVASTSIVIKGREDVEPALKFVQQDLTFDVVSGGAVVQSAITVNSISGSPSDATATLTLSAPVTVSANDTLVRSGSYGYEIQGLLYTLDGGTSTIYGVNRSTYIQYQGNVVDANNQQLKLDMLQQAMNAGYQRGGAKYSALYCDINSQRYYQKLLTPDKRYSNTLKGDGGFSDKNQSYLDWNGLPVVWDKDCPQRFFFLSDENWKNYVLADLEFADETGSMMIAQTGADSFEVRVRLFSNLFCDQPAAQAVLKSYLSP